MHWKTEVGVLAWALYQGSPGYNFMDLFSNYLPVKVRKVAEHLHQVEGVRDH